jgi:hypothetical protein
MGLSMSGYNNDANPDIKAKWKFLVLRCGAGFFWKC